MLALLSILLLLLLIILIVILFHLRHFTFACFAQRVMERLDWRPASDRTLSHVDFISYVGSSNVSTFKVFAELPASF